MKIDSSSFIQNLFSIAQMGIIPLTPPGNQAIESKASGTRGNRRPPPPPAPPLLDSDQEDQEWLVQLEGNKSFANFFKLMQAEIN